QYLYSEDYDLQSVAGVGNDLVARQLYHEIRACLSQSRRLEQPAPRTQGSGPHLPGVQPECAGDWGDQMAGLDPGSQLPDEPAAQSRPDRRVHLPLFHESAGSQRFGRSQAERAADVVELQYAAPNWRFQSGQLVYDDRQRDRCSSNIRHPGSKRLVGQNAQGICKNLRHEHRLAALVFVAEPDPRILEPFTSP